MKAVLEKTVRNLPLEEQVALNLYLSLPETVELELNKRIARMRSEPHVGIPWRDVLKS
jgi:hypothetical protein